MSTPVQRQYWELKKQHPEAVLFFRLGDFYEMFYEDAQLASRLLGIALTARHKKTDNEMPMCGFPYHAHEEYLEKLIDSGYKVAIAEQIEDPESKKISRKIVRVVTPGTSLEKGNLIPEKNSFLAAVDRQKNQFSLAYSDVSTGEFRTALFEQEGAFWDELYKIDPSEILIPQHLFADEKFCQLVPSSHLTPRPNFSSEKYALLLKEHFGIETLGAFGIEKVDLLIRVSGAIMQYLQETQKAKLSHIATIARYSGSETMHLDRQTFRHLEIFEPLCAGEGATLWSVFASAFTALGARRLHSWLANPLLSREKILQRQEAVEEICQRLEFREQLSSSLKCISDLERLLSRLVTGRGNGRDLAFFRDSFSVFPELAEICQQSESALLREKERLFRVFESLTKKLQEALVDNPPTEITEGGIFRNGFSERLDELRMLSQDAQKWLDTFLSQQKKESGISNLRIKFSRNFGFCLEVSTSQKDRVPSSWVRRQTLVNAERFTTPELAEYEEKILASESQSFELEHQMFLELQEEVSQYTKEIREAGEAIGEIDALLVFARTAISLRWKKPEIRESEAQLFIQEGRHPVVEKISSEPFIANDLRMDEDSYLHLITGPNMAGKSTFLRQNALILFLAQVGSFVPAKKVQMGIFDRIFTRVGASDNLAEGKSTFFVEMTEAAKILHLATEKSFIILDEIGRGTSTFDGISLAWAITEFLHDQIKAKTLFATHYHELIDLVADLKSAANFHVTVSQDKTGIVFLRHIAEGGISDSFGIEVAQSAGIPKSIILQARKVLERLESESLLSGKPTLFSAPRVREKMIEKESPLEKILDKISPEELTPRQALDVLFDLKKKRGTKS